VAESSPEAVREATRLLAEASTVDDVFLVMTTADLRELLTALPLDESQLKETLKVAHSEFNAPKLAHLDAVWRPSTDGRNT
jgi:hypothetical protein